MKNLSEKLKMVKSHSEHSPLPENGTAYIVVGRFRFVLFGLLNLLVLLTLDDCFGSNNVLALAQIVRWLTLSEAFDNNMWYNNVDL